MVMALAILLCRLVAVASPMEDRRHLDAIAGPDVDEPNVAAGFERMILGQRLVEHDLAAGHLADGVEEPGLAVVGPAARVRRGQRQGCVRRYAAVRDRLDACDADAQVVTERAPTDPAARVRHRLLNNVRGRAMG